MSTQEKIVEEARELVKKLGLLPPNKLTPKLLAKEAVNIGRKNKMQTTVLGEAQMRKLGLGGVLAISRGSSEEAQGIILDYHPKNAKKTIALIGKGVTFDSGGISIKPSRSMHDMKYDMLGGATVLAVAECVARLKLPYRIVTAVFATENMPGGNAVRPGDVITMHSGKTVEVVNTDAEGRLLLADSISYVEKKYKPGLIIDIATLTHAVTVALGNKITGAFGNNEKLNKLLEQAGRKAGEPVHFLPLFAEYKKELQSKVADFSNISPQRFDAIVAALFVQEFVNPKTPWIHIDIGGTAYTAQGPSGVMVGTLVEFLSKLSTKYEKG